MNGTGRALAFGAFALLTVGCATPVGTTRIDFHAAYRLQYSNALASGQASEPSKAVLRRLGLLDQFEDEPAAVLAQLHKGLSPAGDEERLLALAELSFLHADRTGDRGYFLASAVYAYATLFPGYARERLPRSDPRVRLVYDLYNQSLAQGLDRDHQVEASPGGTLPTSSDEPEEVRLESGTHALPFGSLGDRARRIRADLGRLPTPAIRLDEHARGAGVAEPLPAPRARRVAGRQPGAG